MFFIFSISNQRKILGNAQAVLCDICGQFASYEISMTYQEFTLFFIPSTATDIVSMQAWDVAGVCIR